MKLEMLVAISAVTLIVTQVNGVALNYCGNDPTVNLDRNNACSITHYYSVNRSDCTVRQPTYMYANEDSCNPAGTITVDNPNSTYYTGAFAQTVDSTTNCTVVLMSLTAAIVISDCSISKDINLFLLPVSELPDILEEGFDYHVIRCQQIPSTGVYRMVTDDSWVTNIMTSTEAPLVTPRIILQTHLEDIESGMQKTTAIVGEPILWEMDGPEGYIILPVNCTAYSGLGTNAQNIIYNGCSLDTYLVSHFDYADNETTHILHAMLYAFRFADSEDITIICSMRGCLNTSTACDFTCPSSERRRRDSFPSYPSPEGQEQIVIEEIIFRNRRRSPDFGGSVNGEGSVSLRVFYSLEDQLLALGQGYRETASFLLMTIIAFTVQVFLSILFQQPIRN